MRRIAWTTALLVFSTLAVSQSQPAASEHRIVTPAEQKFAPFPNIPECAKGAVLHGDPNQGASTILVKSTGACTIPSHWHTPNEQVLIATGSARLEVKGEAAKRLTTGAYAYLPSKHAHAFSCPMACSYFIIADDKFDIHYVDEGGNEIPPDQALAKAGHAKKPKPMPKAAPAPKS
jgi:quercetin dioxygenase-like cupin family protein